MNKPISDYERMEYLEKFKNRDVGLDKESSEAIAKYQRMRYEAFIEAGFTEMQALYLTGVK